jgi:uncharacterized coiled-coil protein SlyX
MRTIPLGRPRQRWQEDVMEDLKKLKVENWKEAAKDRRTWRDLAEKAKNPQSVVVPNDDDDDDNNVSYFSTGYDECNNKSIRVTSSQM